MVSSRRDAAKNPPVDFRFASCWICPGAGRKRIAPEISPSAISGFGYSKWQRRRRCASLSGKTSPQRDSRGDEMKTEDRYLKFVLWSDDDNLYVGYCPDLFPWGGVCHGATEEATYSQLCALVREEVEE